MTRSQSFKPGDRVRFLEVMATEADVDPKSDAVRDYLYRFLDEPSEERVSDRLQMYRDGFRWVWGPVLAIKADGSMLIEDESGCGWIADKMACDLVAQRWGCTIQLGRLYAEAWDCTAVEFLADA